ncbi:hypothetical protein ABGT15_12960 [Flavobacterium enshiense]|uniref:hypothetical protein n=1 Tax=Flavobacterium enshiense TaxID=1341165 RepID=UPI00345C7902
MRFRVILLIIITIPLIGFSQKLPKDSLFGSIKKIREKVIFLTKKENPQIIYESDYGHMGFQGPEKTISIFNSYWYSDHLCYYINYERHFNKDGKIAKDIWYGKNDVPFNSYRYTYDKKGRINTMIDSSMIENIAVTKKHYYEQWENSDFLKKNIIHLDYNFFTMYTIEYVKGKKVKSQQYNDEGIILDTIFKYNDIGKLDNYISKRRKWSSETNSVRYESRKKIYEYDIKNRLIGIYTSSPFFDNEISKEQYKNKQFEYDGNNLKTEISFISDRKKLKEVYINYIYDKSNRLIKRYSFDKDISKASTILEYTYKKDKIAKLNFSQEEYNENNNKYLKKYTILYKYKYDNYNNWIEIIKTVDGIDLYKWIREIEYY